MFLILIILGIVLIIMGSSRFTEASNLKKEVLAKSEEIESEKIQIANRERIILRKEENIKKLDKQIVDSKNEIKDLKNQKEELSLEINNLFDKSLLTVYESTIVPNLSEISSSEIKNQLSLLKIKENELILESGVSIPYKSTKREENNLKKKMLLPLDSEITGLLNKLTLSNIDTTRNKIIKSFDKINRLFKDDNASLNNSLLELKLKELELNYSYIVKVDEEKEQQRAIKEQMLEEEKVRREIDREKKRIEKEEKQFNSEITKLMSYMQKSSADVEKELYANKIKELEDKLKELESIKENVLQRELNTRAGYVYIISNIGSFGEDIFKIGMTRRLEPMDRVKELGSASVPFEFDVHAMIFSEDAPKLENQLHHHFKNNEVNKINPRKEFFKVSLKEIEKVVLENYNGTVTFTEVAKAEQYRRSLELGNNIELSTY